MNQPGDCAKAGANLPVPASPVALQALSIANRVWTLQKNVRPHPAFPLEDTSGILSRRRKESRIREALQLWTARRCNLGTALACRKSCITGPEIRAHPEPGKASTGRAPLDHEPLRTQSSGIGSHKEKCPRTAKSSPRHHQSFPRFGRLDCFRRAAPRSPSGPCVNGMK